MVLWLIRAFSLFSTMQVILKTYKPAGLQFLSIRIGAARTARPRTTPAPTANTADAKLCLCGYYFV